MGVQSSPVTQSNPHCQSATPQIPIDLATPERVLGLPLTHQPRLSILSLKQQLTPSQDGRVQDPTKLPRRLRGFDQQADQHGVLRLLCLSLYVVLLLKRRPGTARVRGPLCQGVGGGDGEPEPARANQGGG